MKENWLMGSRLFHLKDHLHPHRTFSVPGFIIVFNELDPTVVWIGATGFEILLLVLNLGYSFLSGCTVK